MTTTILDPVLGAPARELLFLIRCRPRGEYLWDGRTDQVWTKYTELEKRRRKREREGVCSSSSIGVLLIDLSARSII